MVTIIAQCFYGWQIWRLSGNIFVTGGILLLAVAAFVLGLYITVHLFRFPTIASIATHSFQSVSAPVQATAGACDIAITLALIFYFHSRRRSGIKTTEAILHTLIIYAMCRGILTSYVFLSALYKHSKPNVFRIAQIMFLILNVAFPQRTYWQPFHQLVGKLYVNSILASVNVRKAVRGKGDSERSAPSGIKLPRSLGASGSTNTTTMPLEFMTPKKNVTETVDVLDEQDSISAHHSQEDSYEASATVYAVCIYL
ncbi:hypothetical protein DFH06DRAFT_1331859 [Mycena polygramma]|nr:hypothetical protein DFH06DRAFT_1331859 [Mycena polygramma]